LERETEKLLVMIYLGPCLSEKAGVFCPEKWKALIFLLHTWFQ
jgi:hypothetical protein